MLGSLSSLGFPSVSPALEKFGLKFSSGGSHTSRTMMLAEIGAVLVSVPQGSSASDYRVAVLQRNILGKTTDSTRQKTLRHLRELYALDEPTPIFGLLRRLYSVRRRGGCAQRPLARSAWQASISQSERLEAHRKARCKRGRTHRQGSVTLHLGEAASGDSR